MNPRPLTRAPTSGDGRTVHEAMRAAFYSHTKGADKFTRRMAIMIADFFGVAPMDLIAWYEDRGIIKSGSVDWFKHNGGITQDHITECRHQRTGAHVE